MNPYETNNVEMVPVKPSRLWAELYSVAAALAVYGIGFALVQIPRWFMDLVLWLVEQ